MTGKETCHAIVQIIILILVAKFVWIFQSLTAVYVPQAQMCYLIPGIDSQIISPSTLNDNLAKNISRVCVHIHWKNCIYILYYIMLLCRNLYFIFVFNLTLWNKKYKYYLLMQALYSRLHFILFYIHLHNFGF